MQIDITNYCGMSCLYCSRYNRHLRKDQRQHMTIAQFTTALDSLKNWPAKIGIIGGEPVLHPEFLYLCDILRQYFPKEKLGLWTSGGPKYQAYLSDIENTFGFQAYNEHNEYQLETCKHQPLTVAIQEVIADISLMDELISDCWVQRTWCPTINHFGAYFCEVAAAQDALLNEGRNAWSVISDWWKKEPTQFQDQVQVLCGNCGMAIPMERELIKKKTEKFTPLLLQMFRDAGLNKVSIEDIEVVKGALTREIIETTKSSWTPGNYRGDLNSDETAPEGKGCTK